MDTDRERGTPTARGRHRAAPEPPVKPPPAASLLLAAAVTIGCSGNPGAEAPADTTPRPAAEVPPTAVANSPCDGMDPTELLAVELDAQTLPSTAAVTPDVGLGQATATWQGDLDGDGRDDLLLRFSEACGNYGECPHLALIACSDGRYLLHWGPGYAVDVRAAESAPADGPSTWRELILVQRRGDPADERASERRIRFAADGKVVRTRD